MRLYYSAPSPFSRVVRVVLHETGLAEQTEFVEAAGTAIAPGSLPVAQNPLGKIPTLERAEGPALYDSRVINRYLDDRADGGLYPSPPRLWETLTLEALGTGIMEAAVLIVYESRLRPEAARSQDWIDAQMDKVSRGLDCIEDRWISHLKGPMDISHVVIGCTLGYLDFRQPERDWRASRPALAEWEKGFAERASMAATAPQG